MCLFSQGRVVGWLGCFCFLGFFPSSSVFITSQNSLYILNFIWDFSFGSESLLELFSFI